MHHLGAGLREFGLEPGADLRIGAREPQIVQRGLDVESGAADEQGHPAPRDDIVYRGPCLGLVPGDVQGLADVVCVDEVMNDGQAISG